MLSAKSQHTAKTLTEMVASLQEIASGSETMLRASTENTKAMHEMADGMQHINESTFEASEESMVASKEVEQGESAITRAVNQMESISESVGHSAALVKQMNERSDEINDVVAMIKEIAGQINLLSLNAAIEAARAGEHGRGFAVVSSEVRKLAEQTDAFSNEIGQIIQSIQKDSVQSVQAMKIVTEEVQSGAASVSAAGDSFKNIKALIVNVSEKIQTVSAATQQVSASMEEVSANAESTLEITHQSQGSSKLIAVLVARNN